MKKENEKKERLFNYREPGDPEARLEVFSNKCG